MRKIFFFEGNTDGTVGGSYFVMFDLVINLARKNYAPVVGFYNDNYLVPKLKEAGIETYIFRHPKSFSFGNPYMDKALSPLKKMVNLFKKLILPAYKYSKFIKKKEIQIVNLNNSIRSNHAWMLGAELSRTLCITHEMGINTSFTKTAMFLGKRLAAIICVSNTIREYMKRAGVDYQNMHVVHNGIDIARYKVKRTKADLREEHGIEEGDIIIGVIGNIKEWKGQETIVRSTVQLVKKYDNLKCLLVGALPDDSEWYYKKLKNIIEENNIGDKVIFTGFKSNPIDYINLIDIVVHTSIDPEPFGIVILEAMLLAKPIISTTIGGPAEIVIDKKTGILVDPGKPDILSEEIDRLVENPEYAKEIGDEAYKLLKRKYTFEHCLKNTTKIYDGIMKKTVHPE